MSPSFVVRRLSRQGLLAAAVLTLANCASQDTFKDEGSYTIGAPPEKDRGQIHGSIGTGAIFSSNGRSSQWVGAEGYWTKGPVSIGASTVREVAEY